MAKQRYINTIFWRDEYISGLDPSEKLLYLYFLTNPDTNICGIYQIPLKIIAVDTGFDKEMIEKILARFEKDAKILYRKGWAAIKNFIKHQSTNPKIERGIENELSKAPADLRKWIAYDRLSYSNSNTNSNTNSNSNIPIPANNSRSIDNTSALFDEWWNAYGKKVGRAAAFRQWEKLNVDEAMFVEILSHTALYVAENERQFRKDPERYLRHQCWKDEIISRKKSKLANTSPEALQKLWEIRK